MLASPPTPLGLWNNLKINKVVGGDANNSISIAGIVLVCKIEVICWNTSPSGKEIIPHKVLVRRPTPAEEISEAAVAWSCDLQM